MHTKTIDKNVVNETERKELKARYKWFEYIVKSNYCDFKLVIIIHKVSSSVCKVVEVNYFFLMSNIYIPNIFDSFLYLVNLNYLYG